MSPKYWPVLAAESGIVRKTKWLDNGGFVQIDHGGWFTEYLHLAVIGVDAGDRVAGGDILGVYGVGEYPHLHFQARQAGRYLDAGSVIDGATVRDWATVEKYFR